MSRSEFYKYWDDHHLKFQWFFQKYTFNSEWQGLQSARDKEHYQTMITLLERVYVNLPANKFNNSTNPKGWYEFTALLNID